MLSVTARKITLDNFNHGQPNNSFNPTGISAAVIRKIEGLVRCGPAG